MAAPPADSERRQATILFADITGFTAMSERLDPEEVTAIVDRCFRMLETAVRAEGGHVDKYIGDCIMALFGLPAAVEDAPTRAVNAAIAMRNGLERMNGDGSLPTRLGLHVGINTGLVVAGSLGGDVKRDYTVIGDAVNLASRLKDQARDGAILVGPLTHRYTEEHFAFDGPVQLRVKGKARAVEGWEVVSVRGQLHRVRSPFAEAGIASRLVGRTAELARVRERLAALASGRGGIVSIVGAPGLGKSRLLSEAAALPEAALTTWLEGWAVAVGERLPFHPFADLLRGWAQIGDDESETEALEQLAGAVTAVMGDATADLLPFLAVLMGLPPPAADAERLAGMDGDAMERLIWRSVREVLRRLAGVAPVVLVLEDLHWVDQSSLKLLEALLPLARETPLLFVLVHRPDHPQTAGRISDLLRSRFTELHTHIALTPLDDLECDLLTRNLLRLPVVPPELRELITRCAEGNPFYLEEVLRSLIDDGVLEPQEGRFCVTKRIDAVALPATIQEIIMARVDRLPEATRHVLQLAAVIGRSFSRRILARVFREALDLDWHLASLRHRQLLRAQRAGDDVQLVFEHALTQQALYESLLLARRRELHRDVARAIEDLFADRLSDAYGMLAYHYGRAEELAKAEEYLFRAADEAARAAAPDEALDLFREASRVYMLLHGDGGDPARLALLEKKIGLALITKGHLAESVTHFDRALAHLGEPAPAGGIRFWSRFAADMPGVLYRAYRPRRAYVTRPTDREVLEIRYNRARAQTTSDSRRYVVDTIGSIRRLGRTDPDRVEQACGMYAGAAALFAYAGLSFAVSRRFLAQAESLVRPENVRDRFLVASYHFVCCYLEGDWDDAHAVDPALIEDAERHGLFWDVNTYLGLDGERKICQGRFADADEDISRLARLAQEYGYDFARSNHVFMRGFLALQRRRLEDGLAALAEYLKGPLEEARQILGLGTRARLLLLGGDPPAAAADLARAEALGGSSPPYHLSACQLARLAYDVDALEQASLAGDRLETRAVTHRAWRSARHALRQARVLARDRPLAWRLVGRLHWLLDEPRAAMRWWRRSVSEAERLGALPDLARMLHEIADRVPADAARAAASLGIRPERAAARAEALFAELRLEADSASVISRRVPSRARWR